MARFAVKPLTPARWKDFEALFGARGACEGCWCQWNRLPAKEYRSGRGLSNKRRMRRLVASGAVPGLLAYDGGRPVGWAALGPRSVYKRLEASRVLKPVDAAAVWSVPCFFTAKDARGKGVTPVLLEAAAAYARKKGAPVLEGSPLDTKGKKVASAFAWWGVKGAFDKAGFTEVARRSKTRPVMRRRL